VWKAGREDIVLACAGGGEGMLSAWCI